MSSRTARWSGVEPLVKTIVATRRGYDHLGWALAGEAFGRGFNKATSKAFMGDGLKVNWSLYLQWLEWVWAGEVQKVFDALQEITSAEKEVPEAIRRAITYLTNNALRMNLQRISSCRATDHNVAGGIDAKANQQADQGNRKVLARRLAGTAAATESRRPKRNPRSRNVLESPRGQARRIPPSPPQDQNHKNLANPVMHPATGRNEKTRALGGLPVSITWNASESYSDIMIDGNFLTRLSIPSTGP